MNTKFSLFATIGIAILAAGAAILITREILLSILTEVPETYYCSGVESRVVKIQTSNSQGGTLTDTTINLKYECNEILLNPNIGSTDVLRTFLTSKNFTKVETCICPDKLELWRYSGVGDVDAIGVIKNPPPGTGGVGLGLNYSIEDTLILNSAIGTSSDNNNPPGNSSPVVKIAIVDTGVDNSPPPAPPAPHAFLYPFLWSNTQQPCGITPGPLGVNVLDGLTPIDFNGHGTHINGIVAGFPPQAGSNIVNVGGTQIRIRLEILNAKFTEGNTTSGNLFQAICALYYSLEQKAEVINISWGYISDSIPRIMQPFLKEANDSNVVIVAGLGNDGKTFSGPAGTLRFWPAGFSETFDNVISVGASDNNGKMASFSNFGDINIMNVVAPGTLIVSTFPKYLQTPPANQTGLAVESGTSMATPFVTRTVAIMIGKKKLEHNPSYTPADIKTIMKNNANPGRSLGDYTYKHDNAVAAPL